MRKALLPKSQHLPKVFTKIPEYDKLITNEWFITIKDRARTGFSVLVFENWKDMSKFWAKALSHKKAADKKTLGLCSRCEYEGVVTGKMYYDPKYIAVIGFVKSSITEEIVIHECVHAGMAYGDRMKDQFCDYEYQSDEEKYAYPISMLATRILVSFRHAGLL